MRTPQAKRPTRRATSAAEAAPAAPQADAPEADVAVVAAPPGIEWSDEQTPFGRVISVRSGDTTFSEMLNPAKPDVDGIKARLLARVAA